MCKWRACVSALPIPKSQKSSKNALIMAKILCGLQDTLYTIAAHRKGTEIKQWTNYTIPRLSFAYFFF